MSNAATYRIELSRDLALNDWPWRATIFRISDGMPTGCIYGRKGDTDADVEQAAREQIAREQSAPEPRHVYVDDNGFDAMEGRDDEQ